MVARLTAHLVSITRQNFRGGHWKTMTMFSTTRAEGVMQDATVVIDGVINGETFLAYVEQFLVPALRPGDVVVMDNLGSHKMAGVRNAIEKVGFDLWYLPPYTGGLRGSPGGRT